MLRRFSMPLTIVAATLATSASDGPESPKCAVIGVRVGPGLIRMTATSVPASDAVSPERSG